ncbi:DMT family transporter [Candidatus Bariatricus faecipullorum]
MRQETMQSTKKGLLEVHLAVMLFGIVGIFAKTLQLPSIIIVWGRVFFSSIFLFLFLALRRQKIRLKQGKDYAWLFLGGAILALHWTSFMQAVQVSTVAVGTLAFSTFPLFAAFLEPLVFREKWRLSSVVEALVMLAGIVCMVPELSLENQMTAGVLWGLLSALTYAVLALINRKYAGLYQGSLVSFYEQASAAVLLIPALLLWKGSFTAGELGILAVLGVVFTGGAHSLFISGLRSVRVRTAGIISGLESVYGIIAAFLVLKEVPGIREVAGGLIILGVVFYSTLHSDEQGERN